MPGADLRAQLAPDADLKINRADPHRITRMRGVRNFIDAIHRTDGHARIASGTQILVQDRQLLGKFFLLSHENLFRLRLSRAASTRAGNAS